MTLALFDWLRPHALPVGVQACFTSRQGGMSPVPWNSFNLGDHVGDDPQRVQMHRQRLAQRLGCPLFFLRQVHGTEVVSLAQARHGQTQADAVWTDQPGQGCVILVADCLPVLWSSDDGEVVAASHAGWRGLLGQSGLGVIETTFAVLRQRKPQASWQVWLGPAIGPGAFEVGPEVRAAFLADDAVWQSHFSLSPFHPHRFLMDLPGMARQRLQRLGVERVFGNDGQTEWCTHSNDRYFSHRRDARPAEGLNTGRMAAVIWRPG